MKSKKLTVLTAVALAVAGFASHAQAQKSTEVTVVTGISKPSVHSKLGLNQLAIIRELPIKEGQAVKKGDLLLQQDDRQEQAVLEGLNLEATSNVEIQATEADLKVKQVQLKRVQDMRAKNAATALELEEAEVKVVYAQAQVDLAKLKQQTKQLEAKRQGFRVDQMRLTSPVDGFVEQIDVSVGEVTDPQKPVMTVVSLDPIWVEFYLPVSQAQKLKVGQAMEVRSDGDANWSPGKVIYRAPLAEAGAGMQKLRIELPNPNHTDAGQQMQVKLPAELGAAPQAAPSPAAAVIPAPAP